MTKTRRAGFRKKRRRGGRKTVKRRGGRRRTRVTKRRGGRRRSRVKRRGRSRRRSRGGVGTTGLPKKTNYSDWDRDKNYYNTAHYRPDWGAENYAGVKNKENYKMVSGYWKCMHDPLASCCRPENGNGENC